MKTLEKLNQQKKEMLFKAPAYVSLLATNADREIDEDEKKSAINFAPVKTYSCDSLLSNFYKEAEKVFTANFDQLTIELTKGQKERKESTNNELLKLEPIFLKLGNAHSETLHHSCSPMPHTIQKHLEMC